MGQVLTHDSPDEVVIRWRGLPPLWPVRVFVPLAFLGLTGMFGFGLWESMKDKVAQAPGMVSLVLLVFSALYLFICSRGFSIGAGFLTYWNEVRFSAGDGFVANQRGWWGFEGGRYAAPLADIDSIDLRLDREQGATMPMLLTVRYRYGDADIGVNIPLDVRDINKRAEGLDLLLRIGKLVGMGGYVVHSSAARFLDVGVVREADDGAGIAPLPEPDQSARYDLDLVASAVEVPRIDRPEFDREATQKATPLTKIVAWSPGEKIHFHRAPPPLSAFVIIACVVGVMGSVAGFLPLPFNPFLMAAVGAVVAAGIAVVSTFFYLREREVTFDWTAGEVRWRVGPQTHRAPLSSISSLALWGHHVIRTESHRKIDRDYNEFRCQLDMVVDGRRVMVIDTDEWRRDEATPYRELAPLAHELATALGVPWDWEYYRATGLERLNFPRWTMAAVATLIFAALILWNYDFAGTRRAFDHLKFLGATIEEASHGQGNPTYGPLTTIRFSEDIFDDNNLIQATHDLKQLGNFGLDLSGTSVTDEGIERLRDLDRMKLLILRQTAATDASLVALEDHPGLEYLDLRLTGISAAGLDHLQALPQLRYLLLGTPVLNDENIAVLENLQGLRHLSIASPFVTEAGLARLRKALPQTKVQKGSLWP